MVGLIYHDVVPVADQSTSGFPGQLAGRYKLTPEAFRAHMEAIATTGAPVGTIDDRPWPAVALTFDDGGASASQIADELELHGWAGHFFITTGRIGTAGFLSAAGVAELAARGHIVGSHSHTHPTYMGKLTRAALADEWHRSRETLGDILGEPPRCAAVPGGFLSTALTEEAERAGYEVLMTSEPVSRVRRAGRMIILGRYSIWSATPPRTAVGYVCGDWRARARLWLEWRTKQQLKRANPRFYEAGRRVRARWS